MQRVHCQVVVEVQGKQVQLQVLAVLEFNSDRKRMSILCRLPDGRSALLQQRPYRILQQRPYNLLQQRPYRLLQQRPCSLLQQRPYTLLHVCFQKPNQ